MFQPIVGSIQKEPHVTTIYLVLASKISKRKHQAKKLYSVENLQFQINFKLRIEFRPIVINIVVYQIARKANLFQWKN